MAYQTLIKGWNMINLFVDGANRDVVGVAPVARFATAGDASVREIRCLLK